MSGAIEWAILERIATALEHIARSLEKFANPMTTVTPQWNTIFPGAPRFYTNETTDGRAETEQDRVTRIYGDPTSPVKVINTDERSGTLWPHSWPFK